MSTLQDLAQKFADDNGCAFEPLDNGHGGFLQVDAVRVRLVLQPAGSMLVAQTGVGILPAENREEFVSKLLAANDLLFETHGMTLGLNRDAEVVTLQVTWHIGALNHEGFSNLMQHLISETVRWIEILSDPRQNAEGSGNPSEETEKKESWVQV